MAQPAMGTLNGGAMQLPYFKMPKRCVICAREGGCR